MNSDFIYTWYSLKSALPHVAPLCYCVSASRLAGWRTTACRIPIYIYIYIYIYVCVCVVYCWYTALSRETIADDSVLCEAPPPLPSPRAKRGVLSVRLCYVS